MTLSEILSVAREAGIRFSTDGVDLILDAETRPPEHVLRQIEQAKPALIRCFANVSSAVEWGQADWLAFFNERAAIAEFDGGLHRGEAEERAFACCVTEWLNRNPVSSAPRRCLWCGHAESSDGPTVLPFGCGGGGYAWLHSHCWPHWSAKREAAAYEALAAIGIAEPRADACAGPSAVVGGRQ